MATIKPSDQQSIILKGVFFLIKAYQFVFRPFMKPCCRFYPSCSDYALTAFMELGLLNGIVLTLKRILRCHPWSLGGYDPVPSGPLIKLPSFNRKEDKPTDFNRREY